MEKRPYKIEIIAPEGWALWRSKFVAEDEEAERIARARVLYDAPLCLLEQDDEAVLSYWDGEHHKEVDHEYWGQGEWREKSRWGALEEARKYVGRHHAELFGKGKDDWRRMVRWLEE